MSSATNFARGPKNFTCSMCGKTFDTKQNLDAHKKKEHSTTPEPPAGVG